MAQQDGPSPDSAQPQAQPDGAQQAGGGVSKMIGDAHSLLMKIADAINSSGAIEDEEKQEFNQLVQGFQMFFDNLSKGPDSDDSGDAAQAGAPTTPEAGSANVQQAM